MKKKIVSLLMAAVLAFSATACGQNAGNASNTASNGSASTDAASGDVIKIGGIGPITGGAAIYGTAVMNAAQIAVEEVNAAGGINGAQIEFNFQDDEHDAEKAINAYNTLKDWGMDVLLGTVTTAPCIAVSAESKNDGFFQITASASSTDVLNGNVFQVCFTDPNQGTASAQYIGSKKLATKVAAIYDSSDPYSSGIYANFKANAADNGIEIVSETAFTADNNTDFSVQLQAAQAAGAELVFLPFYYNQAAIVLKQAKDMGYAPIFFGCDGMDGILTLEGFDVTLAEDLMLLTPFAADAKDEKTQSFVSKYVEKFGETPNQFAADAYDAVYIIKEAFEKAGCDLSMSPAEIGAKMIEVMPTISVDGLTGEGMTWSAEGTVSKAPKAVVIKDGVYVSAE